MRKHPHNANPNWPPATLAAGLLSLQSVFLASLVAQAGQELALPLWRRSSGEFVGARYIVPSLWSAAARLS
jgi:hypothetical protein